MLVDYHNHTVLCRHAVGSVDEYLERATEIGLEEFGFAEHSFWMAAQTRDVRLCPLLEEMPTYFEWMDSRRRLYNGSNGKPVLRVGMEADWIPEKAGEAAEYLATYPFDYVIGSVHHVRHPRTGDWILSWSFGEMDREEQIRLYFEAMRQMVRARFCNIIGHIDVIRRGTKITDEELLAHVETILPDIVESGVTVEINTSGTDHGVGSSFPGKLLLKRLVDAGVPITFGSDSHSPQTVGRYFEEAVAELKECGATTYRRFERGKSSDYALP